LGAVLENNISDWAAGFIGSAFVREALAKGDKVVIYDALTYAGHMPNIESCLKDGICDS